MAALCNRFTTTSWLERARMRGLNSETHKTVSNIYFYECFTAS